MRTQTIAQQKIAFENNKKLRDQKRNRCWEDLLKISEKRKRDVRTVVTFYPGSRLGAEFSLEMR